MEKVSKKKGKLIKRILDIIIATFVILFLLVVCLQRFSGNKISFFNYRLFVVASGSMEPKYKVGDVLISKEEDSKDIKVGDTISYLGKKGDLENKIITHQVISIEKDKSGKYVFHTKGLSNVIEDPIVYENQVFGVVKHKLVLLSFVYKIIGSTLGMFIFVVLPILYIIGSEIIISLLEKEEKRRKKI